MTPNCVEVESGQAVVDTAHAETPCTSLSFDLDWSKLFEDRICLHTLESIDKYVFLIRLR